MRRRPYRSLSPEERQLWHKVTADITPMPKRQSDSTTPVPKALISKPKSASLLRAPTFGSTPAPRHLDQSVLTAGDPRQARRIARGRREIDARVDLHGLTQDQAYHRLQGFLAQAVILQNRCVLIITGKGPPDTRDAPLYAAPRGILRRRFLEWIDGPLQAYVTHVAQAHQRHGGAGAFYVFLKRAGK